jgi:hypothetical protein
MGPLEGVTGTQGGSSFDPARASVFVVVQGEVHMHALEVAFVLSPRSTVRFPPALAVASFLLRPQLLRPIRFFPFSGAFVDEGVKFCLYPFSSLYVE